MTTRTQTATLGALGVVLLTLGASVPDLASSAESETNVLEVTADGHTSFELSAEEIPAGRTTVRLDNASNVIHFALVGKMPSVDGNQKTVEDSKAEVVPVFQNIMDDINGRDSRFPEAGFELPAWYGEVVYLGGPGLTSPGETSEVTLDLDPGTYVIECYVKMADGTFHSTGDMIEGLTVTDAPTDPSAAPAADARVSVSFDGGIQMDGTLSPGLRTVEVTFTDQRAHEHFLGHDVHLVRLEDGADLAELGAWMSWSDPGGLTEPAPSGVRFLGGTQEMPEGMSTYVTVELEPGDYAWIAEVPDPAGKDMLVEFTVQ
jgi:hypothetical protein